MATYNPDQVGVKAPSGGFQQGGWYSGRQYWNGTLSDPGVIHSSSNQQGAGQQVSKEVIGQSGTGNVNYVDEMRKLQSLAPLSSSPTQAAPSGMPSMAGGSGTGFNQPSIDLPSLYKGLYEKSGISDIEKDLSNKEREFNDTTAGINDNPFLSEGTRVGRVAKLDELYQKRTANLKNDVATKKADIETQLNLQSRQFDINSQQAQLALQQFNSLMGMGAFDNASGEDIANITRSTGLSSSMISSAIQANKAKNLQTSVEKYDDGTNEGYRILTLDNTGNVVSVKSQPVGPSQKKNTFDSNSFLNTLLNQNQQPVDLVQLWNSIPD